MKNLYSKADIKLMKQAEDSLNPKVDRVEEIILLCQQTGRSTIGIANCISFNKEADQLEERLLSEGFTVKKVNCKYGKIPFSDLVTGYKGVSCNPVGQADFLNDGGTDINIMMGLCLGHDMLFNEKSKAPVTPLIVKDRKLKHHTLEKFQRS